MSVEAMSWAMDQVAIGGAEKLVLIGIASHADRDGGNAYPSLATLARYASVDPRSVRRILRRLEAAGYLRCDMNQGGSARCRKDKRPNLYELRISGRFQELAQARGGTGAGSRGDTVMSSESPMESPQERIPLPPCGGADGFDEVFGAYPKQVGRSKALQVWQAMRPDAATRQEMLRAIEEWSRSQEWQRNDGQYIPRFTRWLSERRWQDLPGFTHTRTDHPAVQPPLEIEAAPPAAPSPEVRAQIRSILESAGRTRGDAPTCAHRGFERTTGRS